MITLPWFEPLFYALVLLVGAWSISVVGPFFYGAPWVPMPVARARQLLTLADVRPGETVYDLGSGDGRVLVVAAREFGARGVGVEIEPLRALLSRGLLWAAGVRERTRVIRSNYMAVNLGDADVVVLYLLPKAVARLEPKLRQELKPGARVVSLAYSLPDWPPAVQAERAYVYRKEAIEP